MEFNRKLNMMDYNNFIQMSDMEFMRQVNNIDSSIITNRTRNNLHPSYSYTYFKEDISVATWNSTDGLPFIRWYRNNPQGSLSPFNTEFIYTFFKMNLSIICIF